MGSFEECLADASEEFQPNIYGHSISPIRNEREQGLVIHRQAHHEAHALVSLTSL